MVQHGDGGRGDRPPHPGRPTGPGNPYPHPQEHGRGAHMELFRGRRHTKTPGLSGLKCALTWGFSGRAPGDRTSNPRIKSSRDCGHLALVCDGLFRPDRALRYRQRPRKTTAGQGVPGHRSHNGVASTARKARIKSAGDSRRFLYRAPLTAPPSKTATPRRRSRPLPPHRQHPATPPGPGRTHAARGSPSNNVALGWISRRAPHLGDYGSRRPRD